jgi:protocatechuate 3,4-dioxygenase beta subunit
MTAMDRRELLIHGVALAGAFASLRAIAGAREPVLGGTCEGCDWVYDGMPGTLAANARIAPANQAGDAMVIEGLVTTPRGAPAGNVIVYAYHTDKTGIYPQAGNRHGTLRGWAKTDASGRYRFDTIRPGAYPSRNVAEHVHMHVIEPGTGTYYIDNLEFEDDPLNSRRRGEERGGPGLMLPVRRDGQWLARRDIVLGRNIPGYPQAS